MNGQHDPLQARHLFDAVGVELEYMIVDRQSLQIRPIADFILRDESGGVISEVEHGPIAWSNELVAHVVELKTNGPAARLQPLADAFQTNVRTINNRLAGRSACLLPGGMHPWMNPQHEMVLWAHECSEIYETFNRIFNCQGHGWANLQSMHLNLPFCGDEEFGRLHAAVRLLLPLLPAIAASSPLMDGRLTGLLDTRLEVYRTNSRRIPTVAGRVIPEPVFDRAGYDRVILQPMFDQIAPFDPRGVLRNEFLNARGAIARFSRGAIEIRVIDVQECPQADLAIAAAVCEVLKLLVDQTWSDTAAQQSVDIAPLEHVFRATIRDAERAVIDASEILQHFGVSESSLTLQELWRRLIEAVATARPQVLSDYPAIETIVQEGPLARRIINRLPNHPGARELHKVYRELANCLATGTLFR